MDFFGGKKKTELKKEFFYLKKQKKAFTLIELILVVAIIAVIASVVIVVINPNRRIGEVNDSRRWSDITAIAKAIEFYTADYGSLPPEFATSTVPIDGKVVLCSSSASLTCGDQTRGCLVVSDSNFLGVYLPTLPVDPLKDSVTDTGYYLTRNSNDTISIGACESYNNSGLATVAKVELPTHVSVCGDGEVTGDEVCDDINNLINEGCGNGIVEAAGTYCNSTCSAEITITQSEVCDYLPDSAIQCNAFGYDYYTTVAGTGSYCRSNCLASTEACL